MSSVWRLLAFVSLTLFLACGRTALVSGTAEGVGPFPSDSPVPVDAACEAFVDLDPDAGLRARWNAAVASVQPLTRDFRWLDPNDFPHPTFRRGDGTAYSEFSTALVAFWRSADTTEFVRCNDLWSRTYFSGPAVATQKTVQLRPLTLEMSQFQLVPVERRRELEAICGMIGC